MKNVIYNMDPQGPDEELFTIEMRRNENSSAPYSNPISLRDPSDYSCPPYRATQKRGYSYFSRSGGH